MATMGKVIHGNKTTLENEEGGMGLIRKQPPFQKTGNIEHEHHLARGEGR